MNKVSRLLTMVGMGLMAGVTIGAGSAQAAGTTTQSVAKPAAAQTQQRFGGDQVVGYYRSPRACQIAGAIGERFNKWDDYDCDFVIVGFRRGAWALSVERDWDWNRGHAGNWGHGGNGGHGRDHHRGHRR
jgi:hypothetical protein